MRDSQGYDPRWDDEPGHATGFYMVPRGGGMLSVRIDGSTESIFEEISRIDPDDQTDVTTICDRYGLWRPTSPKSEDPDDETIWSQQFKQKHSELSEVLQLAASEDWPSLERVAAKMLNVAQDHSTRTSVFDFQRVPGSKQPHLIIVTRDLFTFSALQVCAAISEGQKIKQCQRCTAYFAVGPNTGRKLDGVYCSPKCRVAAHRAKA
jgi:hypothetical protein